MPAKSRRKRKNLPPSKRTKVSSGKVSTAITNQTTETTVESTSAVAAAVKPEKKSTAQVHTTIVRHPYITSELRTIGIFAVLVLVILGILTAVL